MISLECCPPRLLVAVMISLLFHAGVVFYYPWFQNSGTFLPEEQITRVWVVTDIVESSSLKEAVTDSSIINMPVVTEAAVIETISSAEVVQEAKTQNEDPPMVSEKVETITTPLLNEVLSEAEVFSSSIQPELSGAIDALVEQVQVVQITPLESLSPRGRLAMPPYPDQARRLGYEGRVVLELTISKAGRVTDVNVLEADAPELLINSCISTVLRRWRFISLDREVVTRKTFRFRLKG